MSRRPLAAAIAVLLILVAALFWLLGDPPMSAPMSHGGGATGAVASADAATGELVAEAVGATAAGPAAARASIETAAEATGVRGIVVDAGSGTPLGGVEVLALAEPPSLQPLIQRFRGLFEGGMFVETRRPPRVLGSAISGVDGTFEIRGLPAGQVFLDARSDGHYVRTPASARLAEGELATGIELRASAGGRVRGIVLGVDGGPVAGAAVSLRPGLNSFLGQLTERKYRWLETTTDERGAFDLPGVPTGNGYVLSASASTIALEETFGVDVRQGEVTEVTLRGRPGATVRGRVLDTDGSPLAGANVAMVYLDLTRVLFSADGRAEPIATDGDGRFELRPIAAGRVAFVAVADGRAPSPIVDLAVVDDGVYDDLELQLGDGSTVSGIVVDHRDRPVAGARVELRPFERPDDPQFLKMMLKIRRVEVETDQEGRFTAKGMTGERLVVQAQKPGYTTCVRFGAPLDEELRLQVLRGATVRGRVLLADGPPVERFRVEVRSRSGREGRGDRDGDAVDASGDGKTRAVGEDESDDGSGDERRSGFQVRIGRGGARGGPRGDRTVQLAEGQAMGDRGMDGDWREIAAKDGTFELRGIPPGSLRVRVRADGCLDGETRTLQLAPGETSAELVFTLAAGIGVNGTVVDDATGQPISDAQVTAYRQRDGGERRGFGPFQGQIDGEDFDFLALSSTQGRRSAVTDSKGRFAIAALAEGTYRFTARHPDMAKSSARDVAIAREVAPPEIEIRLDAGGGIEGHATGYGGRPLADAVIAAFSLQTGTLRSAATDKAGYYLIDGLPPGQYVVFKSRLDERADNIPLELMSNMRLKTATVRQGRVSRLDIRDESEDGVRVTGIVREGGAPVPRALVTLLGKDRDGLLGMGVRADAAGDDGRYELAGIAPGNYVVQVSRFQGRPVQTSFPLEVPYDTRDFVFDIVLPTSEVAGRVVDSRGNAVAGIEVTLGSADPQWSGADGLIGLVAQGGLGNGRTAADGTFRIRSVAAGDYVLRANTRDGQRGGRSRRTEDASRVGSATLDGLAVDGITNLENLVVTLPLAGRIEGTVLDGSGNPVRGAEIHYAATASPARRAQGNPIADLFGMQREPIVSDDTGRFVIAGLDPGVYDLRVDSEALEAGRASDVQVVEEQSTDVTLRMVRGATLKVRATNIDEKQIPLAWVTLLDGKGKRVVNRISTFSVLKRFMRDKDEVEDTGWYEFGSVPPDDYTLVIAEPGKPELRISRTILDGETVEWDIDVTAELQARGKNR